MAKKDVIELEGTVSEALPNAMFKMDMRYYATFLES